MATLDILHCLAGNEDLLPFFQSCDIVSIILPFLSSLPEVHLGFRLLATLILSHFHAILPQSKILCLNADMANLMLLRFQSTELFTTILQQGIEDDIPWAEIITPTNLYLALCNLVRLPENDVLINKSIMNVIQNSLEHADNTEKNAALRLLCILCLRFKGKQTNMDESLTSSLLNIQSSNTTELMPLSSYAIMVSEGGINPFESKLMIDIHQSFSDSIIFVVWVIEI